MRSIVIFASGAGTNAHAIIEHFKNTGQVSVSLIVSGNAQAGVLDIARREHIPFLIIDRKTLKETLLQEQLTDYEPSLIVLAGFLWKIPAELLSVFPGKFINIHPALLPRHGGKGMYGQHVHESVLSAGDKESGITIHYVNEVYDSGDIILQARCPVQTDDNAKSLAERIHRLEHFYYPRVVEFLLMR
jgi:phosphoribosylglycinamide formyltransferase 1